MFFQHIVNLSSWGEDRTIEGTFSDVTAV